jgi:Rha family phage regulatory protein
MVSSKLIAEKFQRRHADVLNSIRNIVSDLPEEFSKRTFSFVENTREIQRGEHSEVCMTRDGFALLAMGFNGRTALEWKVRFLEAFNAMEETIRSELPALRAEVLRLSNEKSFLPAPKKQHGNTGLVPAIQLVDTLFGTTSELRKVHKDDPRVSEIAKREGKARQLMSVSCGMQKEAIKIIDEISVLRRK